jgi:two-component system response regulator MtrA
MSKKIFILDDDENACRLAALVLARAGYEVQVQTMAIGATSAIKTFSPDLVLLDVMMPALAGDNLVDIIAKVIKPRPKIVFYSNKTSNELRELVAKTGVEGFVCKVDGPSALVATVRKVLA